MADSFKVSSIRNNRFLQRATNKLTKSFEKLSSGSRINRASDDAAGLAIADSLRAIDAALKVGVRNASDGISLGEIASGTTTQLSDIATRQKELATQSANGTLSDEQRTALNQEFQALSQEARRITDTTEFNGVKLFDGNNIDLQVGEGAGANNQITVPGSSLPISTIEGLDISTQSGAQSALAPVDSFISETSSVAGKLGAATSRLEVAISNNQSKIENTAAAESRIRDVDVAEETSNLVRNKILQQGATAVQAQANLSAKQVLKLLGP